MTTMSENTVVKQTRRHLELAARLQRVRREGIGAVATLEDRSKRRIAEEERLARAQANTQNRDPVRDAPPVPPLRIQITRAGVRILRGGTKATEVGQRSTVWSTRLHSPSDSTACERAAPRRSHIRSARPA